MLSLQVFALTLVPLLSGVVPTEARGLLPPLALLGMEQTLTTEALVGTWRSTDEFFRWKVHGSSRAQIKPVKGQSVMVLRRDGTFRMVNLFTPLEGRWELTEEGLHLFDPRFPAREGQQLTVRARDKDRIWVLFPFAGGTSGLGMVRVCPDVCDISERELKEDLESSSRSRKKRGSALSGESRESQRETNQND